MGKYFDDLFNLLSSFNSRDDGAFSIAIEDGTAYVDCQGDEIAIETSVYDHNGVEHERSYNLDIDDAASTLAELGADLLTVEM